MSGKKFFLRSITYLLFIIFGKIMFANQVAFHCYNSSIMSGW